MTTFSTSATLAIAVGRSPSRRTSVTHRCDDERRGPAGSNSRAFATRLMSEILRMLAVAPWRSGYANGLPAGE